MEVLTEYFEAVEIDLKRIQLPGEFAMIMANYSLHHIKGLEAIFRYSYNSLKSSGIFATADVIRRHGHIRGAETAIIMNATWPMLKVEQLYHALLKRTTEKFADNDCSSEDFEGIRAQDILPIMLRHFYPCKFFATGGFIDLLVDRGFGHGFNPKDEKDVALTRFIADLNEIFFGRWHC